MLCTWCGKQEATRIVKHALYEPKNAIAVCSKCGDFLEKDDDVIIAEKES